MASRVAFCSVRFTRQAVAEKGSRLWLRQKGLYSKPPPLRCEPHSFARGAAAEQKCASPRRHAPRREVERERPTRFPSGIAFRHPSSSGKPSSFFILFKSSVARLGQIEFSGNGLPSIVCSAFLRQRRSEIIFASPVAYCTVGASLVSSSRL